MDVTKLLEGFLGSSAGQSLKQSLPAARPGSSGSGLADSLKGSLPGGLAGGAAAGGLIAMALGSKKARKMGGKALTYGGMAVVGGLAYKAYRDWQGGRPPAAGTAAPTLPAPETGFDPAQDPQAPGQDFRLALVRAMISAAQADGHVDAGEHRAIRAQIEAMELGPEEKGALFDFFSAPSDPAAIAGLAGSDAQRAELYLASVLSIDPDTPEEARYLDSLAARLGLNAGLRGYLDAEAEAARTQLA
ncbi:tellurite resistance TerB family protein [Poseidonocella sp. HB161398]|uniref:tellurite resistance TerB family protein n=1 Tax=Poseidonocella sp. HB161398 TaxID=2320855 RepID=UPI00110826DA|nr:tellurite resistance TerB family protein [Poseidonocella sp. HB161398]